MARLRGTQTVGRRSRSRRRLRWLRVWPNARLRRRWWRAFRRRSTLTQAVVGVVVALLLGLAVNWMYQVIRKPSELLFPVSGVLYKTPTESWQEYGPLFRRHSTSVMTPTLLAAIAQVEGSGNPVARTYWRWSWTRQPFEIFRPASSSVGMYQMTDGTFAEARHYCIHDHRVMQDGPWSNWHSCWFNSLYARVVPGDAIELASAYLDHSVSMILERHSLTAWSLARRQELATMIHLCGAGAGDEFARRGLHLAEGQRCGDQDIHRYVTRVLAMEEAFDRIEARTRAD